MQPEPRDVTFKKAFCNFYRCSAEAYTRRVLFRAFYPHALPLAWLLYLVKTRSIQVAIQAIDQAGHVTTADEINYVINDYRYQLRLSEVSPWVRGWRIRISGQRLLNLFSRVIQNEIATEPNSVPVAPPRHA